MRQEHNEEKEQGQDKGTEAVGGRTKGKGRKAGWEQESRENTRRSKGEGELRVIRRKKKSQEGIRVKRGGRKDKVGEKKNLKAVDEAAGGSKGR